MQNANSLKPMDMEDVANAAKSCNADTIFLHWTASPYSQIYDDYHISIDYDGRVYFPDNCTDFNVYRPHTWHRNTGAIGIALIGCYDAVANHGYDCDFGTYPVTQNQIECMAAVVATICKHAGIDVDNVMTHCEAALEDGYGPYQGDPETRWDLWYIKDSCDGQMRPGGAVLRGKIRWYLNLI